MPRNTHLPLPAGVYTLLTDADVTYISVQNLGTYPIWLIAGVGAAVPAVDPAARGTGAYRLDPAQAIVHAALAELFPGIAGANRVFAMPEAFDGKVQVSHA